MFLTLLPELATPLRPECIDRFACTWNIVA
jgi:hypothetical protein